uniref:Uncharacterized protein n=1 Tax=Anopheles albimanus TaxID=7167 RepID=A0A182FCG7_ANOAL
MARRHNVRRTQISGRCSGSLLLIAVIALVCIAMTTVEAAGCPSMCSCQQRTVRCVKQQLDNVPEMPADTSIM